MSQIPVGKPKAAAVKTKSKTSTLKISLWKRLNPFSWVWRHWGKLLFISALVVTAYAIYLDAQISQKFAGNKWQVPALIYARPMFLSVKQEISIKEIEEELTELKDTRDQLNEILNIIHLFPILVFSFISELFSIIQFFPIITGPVILTPFFIIVPFSIITFPEIITPSSITPF